MSIKSLTILSTGLLLGALMGCNDHEVNNADEYIPHSLVEIVERTEVIVKGKFSKREGQLDTSLEMEEEDRSVFVT
ncbi:hypothetical protein [Shouchella patagoniensis]|uniref:hypothetical protein n=1 Tax=Shouchella patagoniensis TaxID=228576 RepID=UPI00099498DC|nr:hypothetical protein [Shouchella patagoniensis]